MIANILLAAALLLSLTACAPQAELVKTKNEMSDLRENNKAMKARFDELHKRLDTLDANVKGTVDVQKVMADSGAKSDQLAMDIQLLQGKLEENNFHISEFAQKLDDKNVKLAELSARIDELESRIRLLSAGTPTVLAGPAVDKEKRPLPKTVEPSEAYRQAKNDYDKGNFDLALAGFQNYVAQFPDASQVDNAQYWVGECYYSKKDYSQAIEAFGKLIKAYPKSGKVPGAKLKIGLSYLSAKNNAKAKEYLTRVIKEHPDTTEAEIAKDRIGKIAK